MEDRISRLADIDFGQCVPRPTPRWVGPQDGGLGELLDQLREYSLLIGSPVDVRKSIGVPAGKWYWFGAGVVIAPDLYDPLEAAVAGDEEKT